MHIELRRPVTIHRGLIAFGVAALSLSGALAQAPIKAIPSTVSLKGPYSEVRVLIDVADPAKSPKDVSKTASYKLVDPKVAEIDAHGIVRPLKDGKTVLTATFKGSTIQIPVVVSGVTNAPPPSFLNDIQPIMTRSGCNMGSCHGAGQGKGGFKISLQGYDPEMDYEAITRQNGARRVSPAQPENSLLLRKPALLVAHKGGLRLKSGSPDYRVVRDWIKAGMPGPIPKEPTVVALQITPPVRTMAVGQTQRFKVTAIYSDKSTRDATTQSLFTASDEQVATVTPSGEAKAVGKGEGAVLVRYQGLVQTAHVVSPFAEPKPISSLTSGAKSSDPVAKTVDRLIAQKLGALGLEPSEGCSDNEFVRRVYLDAIGVLPTADEVRAFLADRDPNKRLKLIDAVFERPEYVDFWTMKWGDILRANRQTLSARGMYALNQWVRKSVADNKPWDQFARELVLANGSTHEIGTANFFRSAKNPEELAETTSQVFLGVRMQCAKCHNHPYEKWTQDQYYGFAAFFAQVGTRKEGNTDEYFIYNRRGGEVTHLRTKKTSAPVALDAQSASPAPKMDRREALADWLTSPKNPFFSRILVNRIWRHYMGRGFVEPVDDLRATNPPSNPALFDALAQDFAQNGYDVRRLMKGIMRSQAFQLSALPNKSNGADSKYYSHYAFKRMGAEQLLDAISKATDVPETFAGYPVGTRAAQLPDSTIPSYFLELFGKPKRNTACECERSDDPNLGQIMHLMNSPGTHTRIASADGRVAKLLRSKVSDEKIIEELYLTAFARTPTTEETNRALEVIRRSLVAREESPMERVSPASYWRRTTALSRKQLAVEDLLWALLNSKRVCV